MYVYINHMIIKCLIYVNTLLISKDFCYTDTGLTESSKFPASIANAISSGVGACLYQEEYKLAPLDFKEKERRERLCLELFICSWQEVAGI